MKRFFILLSALVLGLGFLGGCTTSNRIVLGYAPVGTDTGQCSVPVAVGALKDATGKADIGHDEKGGFYPASGDVGLWMTRALRDELAARGCGAVLYQDSPFMPDVLLSGEVLQADFVEDSFKATLTLTLKLSLERDNTVLLGKTYRGIWEETVLHFSPEKRSELMREKLQDLLSDIVPEIISAMKAQ